MIVAGDLNSELDVPERAARDKEIVEALMEARDEYILAQFILCHKVWDWDGKTWSMVCLGQEVRSHIECLLGTDLRLFRNVSVRDPQHNLDHYMILW